MGRKGKGRNVVKRRSFLNPKIVALSFLLLAMAFGGLLVGMGSVNDKMAPSQNEELTQQPTSSPGGGLTQQQIANDIEGIEYVASRENEIKSKIEQNERFKEILNKYGKTWRFARTPSDVNGTLGVTVIHGSLSSWNIVGYKVDIRILDYEKDVEGNEQLVVVRLVSITLNTELEIVDIHDYPVFSFGAGKL